MWLKFILNLTLYLFWPEFYHIDCSNVMLILKWLENLTEIFGSISAVVLGEGCFFYLMVWVFVMLDDLITLVYLWLSFHLKAVLDAALAIKATSFFAFLCCFCCWLYLKNWCVTLGMNKEWSKKDIADSATRRETP